MKVSKLNLILVAAGLLLLAADHWLVAETEKEVRASCRTKTAFDKSGSLYCMDVKVSDTTVARR